MKKECVVEMEQLSVVPREITNKRVNQKLRKENKVPAIVYGVDGVHHILVDEREFKKKFFHYTDNTVLFLVDENTKKERCVFVQDMQSDIVNDEIIHLDFYEVDRSIPLKRMIPIVLEGAAPGVKEGGSLVQSLKEVTIEATPVNIPVSIEVSIADLNIGDSIKIKDLGLNKEVKILDNADQEIVSVRS